MWPHSIGNRNCEPPGGPKIDKRTNPPIIPVPVRPTKFPHRSGRLVLAAAPADKNDWPFHGSSSLLLLSPSIATWLYYGSIDNLRKNHARLAQSCVTTQSRDWQNLLCLGKRASVQFWIGYDRAHCRTSRHGIDQSPAIDVRIERVSSVVLYCVVQSVRKG